MTNYNERLDEILQGFAMVEQQIDYELEVGAIQEETFDTRDTLARDKAKQAITSLIKELVVEARIDPFDFVESCEPDCDNVRHAYHQGQWDMATRIEAQQEEL